MKISKHAISLGIIFSSLAVLPAISQAQNTNQLTIINHFDKSLNFIVGRNPEVLPDLSEHFTLPSGGEVTTQVLDNHTQAYVRTEDDQKNFAFWGVLITNNQVDVHGYLSEGIAYSWNTQKVVFCTPEEYKKKNSCL